MCTPCMSQCCWSWPGWWTVVLCFECDWQPKLVDVVSFLKLYIAAQKKQQPHSDKSILVACKWEIHSMCICIRIRIWLHVMTSARLTMVLLFCHTAAHYTQSVNGWLSAEVTCVWVWQITNKGTHFNQFVPENDCMFRQECDLCMLRIRIAKCHTKLKS